MKIEKIVVYVALTHIIANLEYADDDVFSQNMAILIMLSFLFLIFIFLVKRVENE